MAEYLDVMKQFHRMCAQGNCSTATGCPMYPACNISQCRKIAFEKPAEFENRVMGWAKAHPEPRYPTWKEWLEEWRVVVHFDSVDEKGKKVKWELTNAANYPIPADIAEKLEIKPKEEQKDG